MACCRLTCWTFPATRSLHSTSSCRTRISASRWSQLISTAVYLAFVALALPVVHTLSGKYDDNSLIALVEVAAAMLAVPLVVAAALSQFSAAVADTLAATGNMQETTHGHVKTRFGCVLVGGGAIALTWSADTFEIRDCGAGGAGTGGDQDDVGGGDTQTMGLRPAGLSGGCSRKVSSPSLMALKILSFSSLGQ